MTRDYRFRFFRPSVFRAAALAMSVLGLSACTRAVGQTHTNDEPRSSAGKLEDKLDVKLAKPTSVAVPQIITLSGTLVGNEQARVAAGAAGKVLSTHVERGQVVKKGALLVQLDARAVRAQAEEAAAQLESLKAQRAQAEVDCDRTRRMFDKNAISKAEYDRSRTQCETSKWSVSAAEARKALTAAVLKDTQIRAPFDGMVVERTVSAGEYVRPDSTVATLVDVDSLRVELTVPEADVPKVREGMPVDFRTAAHQGAVFTGKVRYIGPSVRTQTRDAIVEALVANTKDRDLRPGMFVTARLELGQRMLPAVPESAVRIEGTLRRIFVEVGGRLEERLVQVGDARNGLVPVIDGLAASDRVVAQLSPNVRDGARVK